jgi:hypothetical protein
LLNDTGEIPYSNLSALNIPVRTRGPTMDFGVALIIANSILAAFIYFILNWLWES